MIELTNLTFGYNQKKILYRDLDLSLQPGSIYGLLGKNGAGKSSLLRLMGGLLYPTAGTINVAGFTPRKREPAFLQEMYFIPEEIYLPSVSLNRFIDTMGPFYPKFSESQFRKYLVEFDVPPDQKLTAMSYGQKKKVIISFGLATNTRVLIMDEPTNGLDIPSKSQFRKIVSSALAPERLVLISTHQVRDLDNLIDGIIIIDESEILLNHSLNHIGDRLMFSTLSSVTEADRVLYAEPSMRGYSVVMENLEQEDSRVDLERLFNAVVTNRDGIKNIFR
ncbi:ABC-2 type transport system ATP-binding protein [Larkinella arboricola]|uniref:ABC-2 type transport system ATP-binding protein n=1 Tax=Larkinella arboricola TaxID=643671 RepID=A0A327WU60_LARAB|nr:ABC transporter ATP-binding protein [Larkinella arboricola]RAJ92280.1 ABC-2 type transport system ATP-binding protein [Larkinella arboricola]